MSRRVIGSTLVAASLLVGVSGASAAYQAPKTECAALVKDSPNDAVLDYGPTPTTPVADPRGQAASHRGTDITGVTVRVAGDRVLSYLTITDIPVATSMEAQETAYQYDVTFAKGTKSFVFTHIWENPSPAHDQVRPSKTITYPRVTPKDNNTSKSDLKDVKGEVDTTRNLVVVSVAREEVETFLGGKLSDGDMFTSIAAKTYVYIAGSAVGLNKRTADVTPATPTGEQASYTVGQDGCFAPATLSVSAGKAQYGDAVKLTATLADDTGAKLADRPVRFSVSGDSRVLPPVNTDANGVATMTYTALVPAGGHEVTASFAGDEGAGRGIGTAQLVVTTETTKFNPFGIGKAGTARTITTTLVDDDRAGVGAQKVDWYVNGRKVATTTTDSKGKTVFKGAKAGQTVQARFAGQSGKYAGANSASVKV